MSIQFLFICDVPGVVSSSISDLDDLKCFKVINSLLEVSDFQKDLYHGDRKC